MLCCRLVPRPLAHAFDLFAEELPWGIFDVDVRFPTLYDLDVAVLEAQSGSIFVNRSDQQSYGPMDSMSELSRVGLPVVSIAA